MVLAVAVSLTLLLFLCPLPFHKEYKCIKIQLNEPTYEMEVVVRFDGYYHLNLFANDSFSGKMTTSLLNQESSLTFPEIPLSKEGTYLYYHLSADGSVYGSVHGEPTSFDNRPLYVGEDWGCIGCLKTERFFKRFAVLCCADARAGEELHRTNWNWNEVEGICMVSDCTDHESARKKLTEMGIIPMK